MLTYDEALVRVRGGAELLDNHFGDERVPWWSKKLGKDRIRLKRLSIIDDNNCICGQLFGGWRNATDELDIGWEQGEALGFVADEQSNDMVTLAWTKFIRDRRFSTGEVKHR